MCFDFKLKQCLFFVSVQLIALLSEHFFNKPLSKSAHVLFNSAFRAVLSARVVSIDKDSSSLFLLDPVCIIIAFFCSRELVRNKAWLCLPWC